MGGDGVVGLEAQGNVDGIEVGCGFVFCGFEGGCGGIHEGGEFG
jgi:hypothetical protein